MWYRDSPVSVCNITLAKFEQLPCIVLSAHIPYIIYHNGKINIHILADNLAEL